MSRARPSTGTVGSGGAVGAGSGRLVTAGGVRGGGASARPTGPSSRDLLWRWYVPLLAGLLPVLLIGFGASALANRLAFAVWAVVVAGGYAALMRVTCDLGWASRFIAAAGLGTLSLGFVAFAALAERHQEIFDLGFRAVAPGLYQPALTRPSTALAVALVLAVAAVVRLAFGGRDGAARRRPGSGSPVHGAGG